MHTVDGTDVGAATMSDEDSYVIPAGWRQSSMPRRDRPLGPSGTIELAPPVDLAALFEPLASRITQVLDHPATDRAFAVAGRAALRDPADATPLGGAVMAATTVMGMGGDHWLSAVTDQWLATRGLVFVARMVVEAYEVDVVTEGRDEIARHLRRFPGHGWDRWTRLYRFWRAIAERVRAQLAAATDQEYAQAVTALAVCRDGSLRHRVVTSFLLPTELGWVDSDCEAMATAGDDTVAELLWCAASTVDQARQIAGLLYVPRLLSDAELLPTGVVGIGPAVAPVLADWFDRSAADRAGRQRLLQILSVFPTDEAMRLLIERLDQRYVRAAVLDAAARYPRRALRVLAEAAGGESATRRAAAELLRTHVLTNPEVVAAALPALEAAAAERVAGIVAASTAVPVAPADALPPVLVTPPWTVARPRLKPVVLAGLTPPREVTMAWAPGEREAWLSGGGHQFGQRRSWEETRSILAGASTLPAPARASAYASGRLVMYEQVDFFVRGPLAMTEQLLPDWQPGRLWYVEWIQQIVARYERDALAFALSQVGERPTAGAAGVLVPFASAEVAALMADWLLRFKSVRKTALAWLRRHPHMAARCLVPAAVGQPRRPRRAAEHALRTLANTHRAEVVSAAEEYGEEAAAAVATLLAADPLATLPAKIPVLPGWASPSLLPQVLLRDRARALPADAVRHLCTMLAISTPDDVYAGVPLVKQACDPTSLAEFGWALFEQWRLADTPPQEGWALTALRWLGDDETVRRLTPLIRAWPGEGGHSRAVAGLDVLAGIGTDLALTHLHGISEKVKFKALKEQAALLIAEVADSLGLTAEQLGDRLVPDLGLDERGSLTLDYGPRRFTVGFDEQLKPYVADETGATRKALPKPGGRDDGALAAASYQRFSALKKDVRTIAANQIGRLEQAMVTLRRWPAAEFRRLFVAHPLLWHIVRRLVWASFDSDGQARIGFRLAEDRTLAGIDDDELALDDDAVVGIAHPLHLGDRLARWSQMFADHQILQPFPQLGRPVHALADAERKATTLERFADVEVPTGKVLGLERRGWRRAPAMDGGVQPWLYRPIPGRTVVATLDPGVAVGAVDVLPEQRITGVWISDRPGGDWQPRDPPRLSELDPITASELLRDLIDTTGSGSVSDGR